MTMVKVCSVEEVPENGMKELEVNGENVFIAHVNGKYYCNQAKCTHAGGPLAEGELKGKTVTCPWHGATFNVADGDNATSPAEEELAHFKTEVRDGEIWAEIG